MQEQQNSQGERPYRSHLRPACVPCRRRKSRCQTETGSSTCLMCRAHGTECLYPGEQQKASPLGRERRRMRAPVSSPTATEPCVPFPNTLPTSSIDRSRLQHTVSSQSGTVHSLTGHEISSRNQEAINTDEPSTLEFDSADDHALNLHIVGPAMTKDNQVLSDYLSAIPGATRIVAPVPVSRSRPVLFTRVQKRPVGITINRSPSAEKLEMIEKLLEPHTADVIDVYFRKVNSCFPLLDQVSFRRQYQENKDRISPALLACLFAHTIVHWSHSLPLSNHRCPDSRFIWNLANEAVYSELHLSPGMSIIKAILLNIGGLPTTSLIGNGVLLGSAVSVAHSLGLNHNPLPWEIPQSEKCLRMKIWWALLVHDRTSLAHGTPPRLSKSRNDVPAPTVEYLCDSSASASQNRPASVYIALVSLTEVLDQHLQYIYQVGKDNRSNPTHLELALNSWVESLSGSVRLVILRGSHLDIPGASNLRFSYLTIRLLLQRIQLEADKQVFNSHDERLLNRYSQARMTADDILIMTQEFQPEQLGDFWLSTSAFSYPATINFLLRCALETAHSPAELVHDTSFRIARSLIDNLRTHQEKYSWNLSDVCLAQHAETVEKILSSVASIDSHGTNGLDPQDFVLPDASIFDNFIPSLWDPLQMQNTW